MAALLTRLIGSFTPCNASTEQRCHIATRACPQENDLRTHIKHLLFLLQVLESIVEDTGCLRNTLLEKFPLEK